MSTVTVHPWPKTMRKNVIFHSQVSWMSSPKEPCLVVTDEVVPRFYVVQKKGMPYEIF